jgi:hypothetical protein
MSAPSTTPASDILQSRTKFSKAFLRHCAGFFFFCFFFLASPSQPRVCDHLVQFSELTVPTPKRSITVVNQLCSQACICAQTQRYHNQRRTAWSQMEMTSRDSLLLRQSWNQQLVSARSTGVLCLHSADYGIWQWLLNLAHSTLLLGPRDNITKCFRML